MILALTMLRDQVSEAVHTYHPRLDVQPLQQRITPPNPSKQREGHFDAIAANNIVLDHDDGSPDNDQIPDNDGGGNMDSDLFDLLSNEEDDDDAIGKDAGKEIRKEHLESIAEAEMTAERALGGNADFMNCDELDLPPAFIEHVFSVVLGDKYHFMNQPKVPVQHEYKKPYYVALMNALLV